MEERNLRKTMTGTVVSDKMDKTVVVAVETMNAMKVTKLKLWKQDHFLKIKDGE